MKNATEKVLIDFKCGHEAHWIAPNNYKSGQGCPIVQNQKVKKLLVNGLKQTRSIIKQNTNYQIKDGVYDFYIPSENVIIEVQGLQHYKYVEYFHKTKENFHKQMSDYDSKWAYARL